MKFINFVTGLLIISQVCGSPIKIYHRDDYSEEQNNVPVKPVTKGDDADTEHEESDEEFEALLQEIISQRQETSNNTTVPVTTKSPMNFEITFLTRKPLSKLEALTTPPPPMINSVVAGFLGTAAPVIQPQFASLPSFPVTAPRPSISFENGHGQASRPSIITLTLPVGPPGAGGAIEIKIPNHVANSFNTGAYTHTGNTQYSKQPYQQQQHPSLPGTISKRPELDVKKIESALAEALIVAQQMAANNITHYSTETSTEGIFDEDSVAAVTQPSTLTLQQQQQLQAALQAQSIQNQNPGTLGQQMSGFFVSQIQNGNIPKLVQYLLNRKNLERAWERFTEWECETFDFC